MSNTDVLKSQQAFKPIKQMARRFEKPPKEQTEKSTKTFSGVVSVRALLYKYLFQISRVRLSLSHYFFCFQKIVRKNTENYHKGDADMRIKLILMFMILFLMLCIDGSNKKIIRYDADIGTTYYDCGKFIEVRFADGSKMYGGTDKSEFSC